MEDIVTAREANQHFSKLLRRAQAGERIIVTSRGRPVAQVTSVAEAPNERLEKRKNAFINKLREKAVSPIPDWSREDLYR